MWTIARLTILETWRRKLLLLTLCMTAVFFVLYWYLAHSYSGGLQTYDVGGLPGSTLLQFYEDGMTTFYLGLFFIYFMLAFFSIFSLASAISGDAESGLLSAILPRPLRRTQFLFGKWVGFAIVQAAYVAVMLVGVTLIVHMVFPTVPIWSPRLLSAFGMFVLEAWTVAAVTLLGSVLFSSLANGIAVSILFGIVFLIGSADQLAMGALSRFGSGSALSVAKTINNVNTSLSLVFPADGLYRRALYDLAGNSYSLQSTLGRLLGPFGVSAPPSGAFVTYAVVYLIAVLTAAAWAFRKKDL